MYIEASKYCAAADMGVADPTQGCVEPRSAAARAPRRRRCSSMNKASASADVWIGNKIEEHGVFMLMCMVLQLINMAVACCYCMKRRADDVMPDSSTEPGSLRQRRDYDRGGPVQRRRRQRGGAPAEGDENGRLGPRAAPAGGAGGPPVISKKHAPFRLMNPPAINHAMPS